MLNSTEDENLGSNDPSDTITNKPNQDSVIDEQTKAPTTESNQKDETETTTEYIRDDVIESQSNII